MTPGELEAQQEYAKVALPAIERLIRRFEIGDELVADRGYPRTEAERFGMEMELRRRIAETEGKSHGC